MNKPLMTDPIHVTNDTTILPAYVPLPGLGVLSVNSFLIEAPQPVLVDTGVAALGTDFLANLHKIIDPGTLRWIWITHADADHVGNLAAVLAEAPEARVVTTFLGMGKMNLMGLPTERIHLLNPGQRLDVGDRSLLAVSPPSYDAPETTGLFDPHSRTLFSSDCFGALLDAPVENAANAPSERLRDGLIAWAGIDSPWLHKIDRTAFNRDLERILTLEPEHILSAHLPPARDMADSLCQWLAQASDAEPFVGPDQEELERMMAIQAVA